MLFKSGFPPSLLRSATLYLKKKRFQNLLLLVKTIYETEYKFHIEIWVKTWLLI